MVQDDGQVRDGLGEVGQFVKLREVQPGFQGHSHSGQDSRARPEVIVGELALHPVGRCNIDLGVRVPGHRVPYAPESVGAGGLEGFQHGFDGISEQQIGVTDYRGGGACGAVQVALAGGGESLHELDLADRAHLLRAA